MKIQAVAFDAYGTLFDVKSVLQAVERAFPGKGETVSDMWRAKQFQYSWLRSLMGRYDDFWSVTRAGLVFAVKSIGEEPEESVIDGLMEEYLRLETFPEAHAALRTLRERGRRLAIVSNGSPKMLDPVVRNAGLDALLDDVISADEARIYKPHADVYALGPARLGVPAGLTLFVSSNAFDAVGAKVYGYKVAWIQRRIGQMEELDVPPDHSVETLTELADLLE